MATVESLVMTESANKQWEISDTPRAVAHPQEPAPEITRNLTLAEQASRSVKEVLANGIEIDGIAFNLMTISPHRTKRGYQMCVVLGYKNGKQLDVNLSVDERYTAESLKGHILTALQATSIVEVFKNPVQVGEAYFNLCQLAQLTGTEVVVIAQSVALGQVSVTLPAAAGYSREDITHYLTEAVSKNT